MHYHIRKSGAATSEQQLTLEAQSFCKQRKQAKHEPAAASDSHIARHFSFLVCPSGGGALFPPHFMRRERASGMHSTAPNTQTCLLSVHCACNTMDGDVSATCTAKRASPASQASGLATNRPCRLQAALFVLTNANGGGRSSWRAAASCQ